MVATQTFFIFIHIWERFPIDSYFSDGLVQPPTRKRRKYIYTIHICLFRNLFSLTQFASFPPKSVKDWQLQFLALEEKMLTLLCSHSPHLQQAICSKITQQLCCRYGLFAASCVTLDCKDVCIKRMFLFEGLGGVQ